MKALAVPAPARTIFRTVDAEELTKPYALKLLLKESENAALTRISTAQGMSRQQLVIGLIRMAAASEAQFTKDETQTLYAATWELRKIGVNINQIARRLNEEAKAGRLHGTEAAQFLKLSTALTNRMEHVVGKVGDLIKASRARCKLVEVARRTNHEKRSIACACRRLSRIQSEACRAWIRDDLQRTVTGWKRTLNRPGTEVPGAYAVGADASIFRACGGDEEHGAHAFLLATGECLHADDESSECSQACSECSEHRSNDCGASIQANGLDNASSR